MVILGMFCIFKQKETNSCISAYYFYVSIEEEQIGTKRLASQMHSHDDY